MTTSVSSSPENRPQFARCGDLPVRIIACRALLSHCKTALYHVRTRAVIRRLLHRPASAILPHRTEEGRMKIEGGCLCGKVRYSADAEPAFVGVCHCKNCQKGTGTAFAVVVGLPKP